MFSLSLALWIASAAPAAGALSTKACELITAADVESVLGARYTPHEAVSNQIMGGCAYSKSNLDVVTVTIMRTFRGAAQTLQMEQEGVKQQGGTITPVSGLGESAYYLVDPTNNLFQLNLGKRNLRVIVTVQSGGKPNIEAALKLARIAYPRLP